MELITAQSLRESNAAFRLPAIPHLADRIEEMRQLADTGVEHAMVVDWHSGAVLWRGTGDAGSVDLTPASKLGVSHGNLIIHTHPGPAECSIDDAACVNSTQAKANIAVCADGTTSIVGPLNVTGRQYATHLPLLAREARTAYRINTAKCNAEDAIEIARDNYAIAHMAKQVGWARIWLTRYSDALIAAMPTETKGE